MTYSAFTLIIIGVLLNAFAQLALKLTVSDMGPIVITMKTAWPVSYALMSQLWFWVGLACYGISVIIWILALSRVDVSIAYPMLSIGYIVNAIGAWMILGEQLGPQRILGIAIISIGVIILARS